MSKEQWIREGFSNYFTARKYTEITYEKKILLQHSLECLLPCEFRMEDNEEYYYFETGIYVPFMEEINQIDPAAFFYEFFQELEEIESYLLDLDHLRIEEELLFLREGGHPVFCYLPEQRKNIFEQIRDFLEICMEKISYSDRKKVRFYYEFHSYLVKEKPNIKQIKEYLKPKPERKEELTEVIQETREVDTAEISVHPSKFVVLSIVLVILSFLLVGVTAFFAVKLWIYGLYYKFVLGFLIAAGCFSAVIVCMRRLWREKQKVPEEEERSEDTQQLSDDDQKTVLLTELPAGYLISENDEEKIIEISGSGFVIGSLEEGTDYQLDAIGVSRRHAEFLLEEDSVWINDLGSTNGTKVNGRKVQNQKLQDGDKITIAREEFRFVGKGEKQISI